MFPFYLPQCKVLPFIQCGLLSLVVSVSAQENQRSTNFFVQPGLSIGRNVKNYSYFPESGLRRGFNLDIGFQACDKTKSWPIYYRYPQVGIQLSMSNLGNDSLFGHEWVLVPFLTLNPFRNHPKGVYFRIGLGAAYYTRPYHPVTNRANIAIGSHFTWSFQAYAYKPLITINNTIVSLSAGYSHGSNGHIQLPNFGLNAAMAGLTCQFFISKPQSLFIPKTKEYVSGQRSIYLIIRQGLGINELGGTAGPIGGRKGAIHTSSLSVGMLFKNHLLIRAGLAYRYYPLINIYLLENNEWETSQRATWFASNILFFNGYEFLIGRFGLDIEGGLNLHKPFYRQYLKTFESGAPLTHSLKGLFASRLGLNLHLLSNEVSPKGNLCLGAYINANFGEADFSEVTLTYKLRVKTVIAKKRQ